ncbi:Protein of unknown function [Pyronema omphalodes CBS 100304]|uniref:Uncharacterized protein n=1 Tax=Pyronema omphalodes (strain CBS 100304) TaxID=1076935 RepID=U4LE94_PYROM|nr:Protein of unknown function [Pyronema omphalodes CBS 100304]
MKPPLLLRWWKEKLSLHHDCWAACAVVPLPHTLPSSIHPRVPPSSTRLSPSLHLPPSTPHHTSSRRRQTPILFIRSDLWKIQTINVTNNLLAGLTRTGVALLARTTKRNELVESAGPVVERKKKSEKRKIAVKQVYLP